MEEIAYRHTSLRINKLAPACAGYIQPADADYFRKAKQNLYFGSKPLLFHEHHLLEWE